MIGPVTSGTFGPWVNKSIGMGYVTPEHTRLGNRIAVEIRGRPAQAAGGGLPFYKRGARMDPKGLRYSSEHEWAKVEGGRVRVGITKFAADKLSDIVFVELPQIGAQVEFMQPCGVIESVKAVSAIYSPLAGKVVEVNTALADTPEVANSDPHGRGWILLLDPPNAHERSTHIAAE